MLLISRASTGDSRTGHFATVCDGFSRRWGTKWGTVVKRPGEVQSWVLESARPALLTRTVTTFSIETIRVTLFQWTAQMAAHEFCSRCSVPTVPAQPALTGE